MAEFTDQYRVEQIKSCFGLNSFNQFSWEVLMQTVENIERKGYNVNIYKNICEISLNGEIIHHVQHGQKWIAVFHCIAYFAMKFNNSK